MGSALSRTLVALIASIAPLLAVAPAAAQDLENGEELFQLCASCHGPDGAGNAVPGIGAPAIASLPAWYVEAQLGKYRNGLRGGHPQDIEGLRMRPMSRFLRTEQDVKDVAAYVDTMPEVDPPATVEGDEERGKTLYTPCIACHGQYGGGNEALNGPPLTGQSDWYLVTSINKYRQGIRGGPGDQTGAIMAAMANTLADQQAIEDVVAYIRTLDDEDR